MSTQEPMKPNPAGAKPTTPASGQPQTRKPDTSPQTTGSDSSNPKLPKLGDQGDPRRLEVEGGRGDAAAGKPGATASVNPAKKA